MSRKTVYTAVLAAAASGSIGAAITLASAGASTQAYPAVCLGVSTVGTVTGTHNVGPFCAGSVPANQCFPAEVDASPQADVNVYACLPD